MDTVTKNHIEKIITELEEIEDLIAYNLSYCVSIKETLTEINKLDLLEYFEDIFEEEILPQ